MALRLSFAFAFCCVLGVLGAAPAFSGATSATKILRILKVRNETNSGYAREELADLIDANSNGLDTRQEVLLRQSRAGGSQ